MTTANRLVALRRVTPGQGLDGYVHKFRLESDDGAALNIDPVTAQEASGNGRLAGGIAALILIALTLLGLGALGDDDSREQNGGSHAQPSGSDRP